VGGESLRSNQLPTPLIPKEFLRGAILPFYTKINIHQEFIIINHETQNPAPREGLGYMHFYGRHKSEKLKTKNAK